MPLIVLEGIDGCGKTTQIQLLKDYFNKLDSQSVLFVREPGSTTLGQKIRTFLLDPETECGSKTEMLLYMAARQQLLEEKVLPALKKKKLVIMDRYFYSTIAYQVHALDFLPKDPFFYFVERLSYWTINCVPTSTIYFNISVEEAIKRREEKTNDRIEQRGRDYLAKVHEGYQIAFTWCLQHGHKVVKLDARLTPEELHQQVLSIISRLPDE